MSRSYPGSTGGIEPIEGVANGHARPVQEHPHISLGDFKEGTDLSRIKLLLTAQDKHRPLRGRQRFNDGLHMLQHASTCDMALRRQVFPEFGHAAPVSASVKGIGKTVTIAKVVEKHRAAFPPGTAARLVDQDGVDPARQRATTLEQIDAVKDRDPGVLHDFFGDIPCPDNAAAKADHCGIVPAVEHLEGGCIPVDQAQRQDAIFTFNLPHAAPCLSSSAISETFAFNVQPRSNPSSHCDRKALVAPGCYLPLSERALSGGPDD
jgi:hypothetical protein